MAAISSAIIALRRLTRGDSGKNTLLSAFEAIVLAVLQFAAFCMLVRIAEPNAVSLWVFINSILSIARAADFSAQGLVSFVAEARAKGEEDAAHSTITTSIMLGFLGYVVMAICGTVALHYSLPLLIAPIDAEIARGLLPLFGAVFAVSSLAGVYRLAFLGLERVGPKVVQTIGGLIVFIVAAFVLAPDYGLQGILLAQLLQALASLLYAVVWYHRGRVQWNFSHYWDGAIARKICSYGLKSMAVGGVQLTIEPVIRLLANHFGGLNAVLLVELASRSIMAVRSLLLSAGQVLIPKFSTSVESEKQNLGRQILKTEQFYFVLGAPALMLTVIAAPAIAQVAAQVDATQLTVITAILSTTWFFNIVAAPNYFFLVGQRRVGDLFWVHVLMTGGTLVTGFAAGYLFGIFGAMAGTTLGFLSSCVFEIRASRDATSAEIGANRWHLLIQPLMLTLTMLVLSGAALAKQLSYNALSTVWLLWGAAAVVPPVFIGGWLLMKILKEKD
jgi:O-antigen/teichoic acid export membrane protein